MWDDGDYPYHSFVWERKDGSLDLLRVPWLDMCSIEDRVGWMLMGGYVDFLGPNPTSKRHPWRPLPFRPVIGKVREVTVVSRPNILPGSSTRAVDKTSSIRIGSFLMARTGWRQQPSSVRPRELGREPLLLLPYCLSDFGPTRTNFLRWTRV